MDSLLSRGSPGIALSMSSPDAHFGRRRRSVSRSDSSSSTDSAHLCIPKSHKAMAIPGVRNDIAPPPLPPPRYNYDLANGHDLAWRFENDESSQRGGLPPIKEGSSLLVGFTRHRQPQPAVYKGSIDANRSEKRDQRGGTATLKAPTSTKDKHRTNAQNSTVVRRPLSPTANTMLHGERPLAQESLNRSNQAYDQAVLSKIGKSNSPPRHLRGDSADSPVLAQKLSLQTKDIKVLQQTSSSNEPTTTTTTTSDATTRWPTSPASTGASPYSRPSWRDCNANLRSPVVEGGSNTMALDPELFVPKSAHYRSAPSSNAGGDDLNSRSGRSSYDQNMFTPSDSFDGNTDDHVSDQAVSKQGMKRKSPPSEDDRPRQDLYPRLATRLASRSPTSTLPHQHGSVASTPSSAQQSSYNSAGAFSIAHSSVTSASSYDTQSPRDIANNVTYITSAQPVSSPVTLIAPKKPQDNTLLGKMPNAQSQDQRPAPARIGNHYICACCPKKPKKFETEESLRAHESEKQYSCNFCHNRFKNKNEAERHQNSLHLRRHSWSCAALDQYQAAFSPSGAIDSNSAATDACGYCGEEFPNHPAPDWESRIEHLTNIHKFGECNAAKKFFRADHFRQHLKHSHAGKSGKWTNILEHACVRDEIPPESPSYQLSSTGEAPDTPVRTQNVLPIHMDHPMGASTTRAP